jgi:ABC-type transport system substrate-binding protein
LNNLKQNLFKNLFGFLKRLLKRLKIDNEKHLFPEKWKPFSNCFKRFKKSYCFILLGIIILAGIGTFFYIKNTEISPGFGGTFKEGILGQPRFINPIYLSNNDVDRDLVELLFSGLMKYNEKGEIVNDLVETLEIKEDGKLYEIKLKKDIFWHNGEKITSDDIVFTVNVLQNPEYKSPQAIRWLGINIEKITDNIIQFRLKKPYSGFLETLTEKIVPKHIFEDISPKELPWYFSSKEYIENDLIGSGPFKFKKISQDRETGYIKFLTLKSNENYFGKKPFISEISFEFFSNENDLLKYLSKGKIDGFLVSDSNGAKDTLENKFNAYSLSLPRYFAVFFNQSPPEDKSDILTSKDVRMALNYAVDKQQIIENTISGKGKIIDSPILPDFYGFNPPSEIYDFDKEKAEEILENAGFKYIDDTGIRKKVISQKSTFSFTKNLEYGNKNSDVTELQKCLADPKVGGPDVYPSGKVTGYFGNETKQAVILFQEKYREDVLDPYNLKNGTGSVRTSTRKKLNELCFPSTEKTLTLKFSLTTIDKKLFANISEILKENWKDIGADVEIRFESISTLETNVINSRDFEALLFGEVLGFLPDPFPFWHSSQKESPGLNLISYENKKADKLLEQARASLDNQERRENLEEFQDILIQDVPCLFLLRPDLIYFTSKKINGQEVEKIIEPSKRFIGIENWYIKTRRILK